MTDSTVREGGNGASEGRTVREGSSIGRTVREGAGGETLREESGAPPIRAGTSGRTWLPEALSSRFKVVEALPTRGAEADLFVVAGEDGSRFVAKIYRNSIKPNEEILRMLKNARFEHVVRLEEYDEEGGIYWELMEYIEHSSLKELINQEGPRLPEPMVKLILRELNDALAHLHSLQIEHRDLKPDNILVRTREPIDLVLADWGISSLMDLPQRATSRDGTLWYTPPEATGSYTDKEDGNRTKVVVDRTRWDYWSLGMILVEILTGEHPFKDTDKDLISRALATLNVDDLVEGIDQEGWRNLCRGLLRRQPWDRWGSEEVSLWLEDERDPRLSVKDELPPAGIQTPPIRYYDKLCTSPRDLLGLLREDWERAKRYFARGDNLNDLVAWLRFRLGSVELADAIESTDTDTTLTVESRTFSYIHTIAKFVGDDVVEYKGLKLSAEDVANLTKRAARGDQAARSLLLDIYENRIIAIAAKFEPQSDLGEIDRKWREAVSDYQSKFQVVASNGVQAPALEGDTQVRLLAAALQVSSVVTELRSVAQRSVTSDALECSWFRNLGNPPTASIGSLIIIPHVVRAAEGVAKRRRYDSALRQYGLPARFALGVAIGCLIFWPAGLVSLIVVLPISWIWGESAAALIFFCILLACIVSGVFSYRPDLERFVGNRNQDYRAVQRKASFLLILGVAVPVVSFLWPYLVGELQAPKRQQNTSLPAKEWNSNHQGKQIVNGLPVEYMGRANGSRYTLRSDRWLSFSRPHNHCLHWRGETDRLVYQPSSDRKTGLLRVRSGTGKVQIDTVPIGETQYGRLCR